MLPVTWFRLAVGLSGLLAALGSLGLPGALADVVEEQVDLSLSMEGQTFTNDVGMTFVPVGKGAFLMGSPKDEKDRQPDELQHKVEITKDFYLGTTEVTQKQYQAVVGKNPSWYSKSGAGGGLVQWLDTDNFPVEMVTYRDATAFIDKLNARDRRKSGWKYALPSEAQWEYACRGGPDATTKPIRFAKPSDSLSADQANFDGNPYNGGKPGRAFGHTTRTASYKPNNLGLFDMHGNVWEYCRDWYANDYGGTNVVRDPTGSDKGTSYVIKSGGYYNDGGQCRSARRYPYTSRNGGVGFRVAFVQVP